MELDTSILTDLTATLANPVSLATLIGVLAYALMEILKGFITALDHANAWVKRGVVAMLGVGLGLAFTLPINGGLPAWPQGVLAGLVGSLVMASVRGLGQYAKAADMKKQGLLGLAIIACTLSACAGLQICKDPTLVLRDGTDQLSTTLVFQCGGVDIATTVMPLNDLAGFDLCDDPQIAMHESGTPGKSLIAISCGGVELISFEVDTSWMTIQSVPTPEAPIFPITNGCSLRRVRLQPIVPEVQ